MDDLKDNRFSHIATDVRFKGVPRLERRIKIDKRFQSMFEDESFKLKCAVDKRGRPQTRFTAGEDLKKYYDISSSSSSGDEEDTRPSTPTPRSARRTPMKIPDDVDSESGEESDDEKKEPVIDYARGHGNVETSSSDDDDEDDSQDDDDEDDVEMIHPWGELDEKADRTTESITKRLAVCNMDWDRVKAQDIHVLLSSFVPPGGVILAIKIYLSDFGRERLSKEDVEGPEELISAGGIRAVANNAGDDEKDYHRERVRQYQLNKLRYYYAVVDCDSAQTSNVLYDECDGLEYESSATRLDLRFVPDDMHFNEVPHSVMDTSVDVGRYRPQLFTTAALQQSNVRLTWDETSADRMQVFQRAFNNNDEEDNDLRAYLASSSASSSSAETGDDDDDNGSDLSTEDNGKTDGNKVRDIDGDEEKEAADKEEERIAKYKALLSGIDNEEEMAEDGDVQMEITWGPGLKEQAESIVKKKLLEKEEKMEDKLSSWDSYLERRKEKRHQNFKEKFGKAKITRTDGSTNDTDNLYSDDELPDDVDIDDPFFRIDDDGAPNMKNSKKAVSDKKSKKSRKETADVDQVDMRQQANLELLMMDGDDHKNHFSLKKLLKSDKKSAKKQKKVKGQQDVGTVAGDFQMNVNDGRFTAVYTSHLFNIDPSEPHFKKTGGMAAMVDEKQRRVATGLATPTWTPKRAKLDEKKTTMTSDVKRTELSLLVKSVKSKATSFMTKKQNKRSSKR